MPTLPLRITERPYPWTRENRRKSARYNRSKTAKSRKKKAWDHFSQWKADESGSEDFVNFCKSRGIARTASACFPPHDVTSGSSAKSSVSSRGSDPGGEDFISSLCSGLDDKPRFVRRSRHGWVSPPDPACDTCSQPHCACAASSEVMTGEKSEKFPRVIVEIPTADADCDVKSSTSSTRSRSTKSGKSPDSLPTLQMRGGANERSEDANLISSITSRLLAIDASPRRKSPKTRQASARQQEWTPEVECEVMRLYRNGLPGSNFDKLFDAKKATNQLTDATKATNQLTDAAKATNQTAPVVAKGTVERQVKNQVEAKLSAADQTPSYVLALANLFRKRMQIRKEFHQMSQSEMIAAVLKETGVIPEAAPLRSTRGDIGSLHPPKTSPGNKLAQILNGDDKPTPVALRYRHVANGKAPNQLPNKTVLTYSSIASRAIVTSTSKSPVKPHFKLNTPSQPQAGLPQLGAEKAATAGDEQALEKMTLPLELIQHGDQALLERLLTVLPKPQMCKLAGETPKPVAESTRGAMDGLLKTAHAQHMNKHDRYKVRLAKEILRKCGSDGTLKASPRHDRHRHEKRAVRTGSDLKNLIKVTNGHIEDILQTSQRRKSSDDAILGSSPRGENPKTKPKASAAEIDFALYPMSKARWNGSLGALYSKSKTSVHGKNEDDKDVTMDTLTSDTVMNDPTKPRLMTVSPLDKHGGQIVS